MSFRVLVIPEDPVLNGYILKPLVEMVLAEAGRPAARATVLSQPRVRGYDDAVQALRGDLPRLYRHLDLWLFLPDADRAKPAAMADLESALQEQGVTLLCSPAEPEVEVYACVAYRGETGLSWAELRQHDRFKEEVFEPLLREPGNPKSPGGGRERMTRESISARRRFLQLCPEVARLRDRIAVLA